MIVTNDPERTLFRGKPGPSVETSAAVVEPDSCHRPLVTVKDLIVV